jgi:hypothetical protein
VGELATDSETRDSQTGSEYIRQERGERTSTYHGRSACLPGMATGTVTGREGDAEVSRGHSTEPKGEGRAKHDGTRYRLEVREPLRTEDSNEQLAFRWEGEGEAQATFREGSMRASAPKEPGTLAEGICTLRLRRREPPGADPHAGWCGGRGQ